MPSRLLYIVGTRPEIIRSAKIISEIDKELKSDSILVNTGQHYDHSLMDSFFSELNIRESDYTLNQNHVNGTDQITKVISGVAEIIRSTNCDAVAVYGDTNSSLAAAIAAVKESVKIIHIESGCRSFDSRMQEEHNRRMIDHISNLCLSVSEVCTSHLMNEHVPGIVATIGDPQFDVFTEMFTKIQSSERCSKPVYSSSPIGLLTLHRAENVDNPQRLLDILKSISQASYKRNLTWKFPMHPRARKQLPITALPNIDLIEPLSYRDLLTTLETAEVCITDSGGLQKEAFWSNTPCITVRPSTEWIETVSLGRNILVEDPSLLNQIINRRSTSHISKTNNGNPYGPLGASQRAAERIFEWLDTSV